MHPGPPPTSGRAAHAQFSDAPLGAPLADPIAQGLGHCAARFDQERNNARLEDLAPGLVPPGWDETIRDAAARRRSIEGPDAVRVVAAWDAGRAEWGPATAGGGDG
jgi:hypothetical protein